MSRLEKEFKSFIKENEGAIKAVDAYEKGLVTFREALRMIESSYIAECIAEYKMEMGV